MDYVDLSVRKALSGVVEVADHDTNANGVADTVHANGNGHMKHELDAIAKLYFVRLPRPPLDDSLLKKLQQEFQACVTDNKAINVRLGSKRDIIKELRKQMTQARSLKDTSQPEFEEKLNRLKQLRDRRTGYMEKIALIRNNIKGLDCKSEADLDAKIVELEDKIRYGGIPLRAEKMIVNDISKLRSQREKIKEFELHKETLVELESEVKKVKVITDELDGEFNIIKGERDVASSMMKDFWNQTKVAEGHASKVEEEQKDAVEKKNEALEALEAARREVDSGMVGYSDNRKFSLRVRDLVAAGKTKEAQELCASYNEEWVTKFTSDTVFRSEYNKTWADQRRFAVSELLPESSTAVMSAGKQPSAARGGRGGARGSVPGPPAEKLVAHGAEKAKELIASLMLQARAEAVCVKSNAAPSDYGDEECDVESSDEMEPVAAPKDVAAARQAVPPTTAAIPAATAPKVSNIEVEVPVVEKVEVLFVPPFTRVEAELVTKDQLREEQKLKAQEAKMRKKRRQETADKKRVRALELAKKAQDEERAAKAAAKVQPVDVAPVAEPEMVEEVEEVQQPVAIARDAPAPAYNGSLKPSPSLNAAALRPPSAAVGRPVDKRLKKLKKFYLQNQVSIVVMAVALVLISILVAPNLY